MSHRQRLPTPFSPQRQGPVLFSLRRAAIAVLALLGCDPLSDGLLDPFAVDLVVSMNLPSEGVVGFSYPAEVRVSKLAAEKLC